MDSNLPPVSRAATLLAGLVFAIVLFVPWVWLHDRPGFLYSTADDEVGAYIGGYGMMLVASILMGVASLVFFLSRWWRTGLFCVACMVGLTVTAQFGRVPCTQTVGLSAYDCVLANTSHHFVWEKIRRHSGRKGKSSPQALYQVRTFAMYFLLVAGSGAAALVVSFWRSARRSLAWPSVPGHILHAQAGLNVPILGRRPRESWSWSIKYRYSVDGRAYEGQRAYFGAEPTLAKAKEIVAQFPASSTPMVYYHPQHHGRSVLMPGVHTLTRTGVLLPVILYAIALLFWLYK